MAPYSAMLAEPLRRLREEGRYRVFADIKRRCGSFPNAVYHANGEQREITFWCSNDVSAP